MRIPSYYSKQTLLRLLLQQISRWHIYLLCDYFAIVTNSHVCRYLEYPLKSATLSHVTIISVQCHGWSKVARGRKQLLQFITSFLEKGGIRHYDVDVFKSCNVYTLSTKLNKQEKSWVTENIRGLVPIKCIWNSIVIYLWINQVTTVFITTQTYQLLYCASQLSMYTYICTSII